MLVCGIVFSLEFAIGYLVFESVYLVFLNVYLVIWSVSLVFKDCFWYLGVCFGYFIDYILGIWDLEKCIRWYNVNHVFLIVIVEKYKK